MAQVDLFTYGVLALVILFFFFLLLMFRRTMTGFREGVERGRED